MEELSCHHHHHNHHSAMDIELHNELGFNVDNPYNSTTDHNDNINDSHLVSFVHPTNLDNNIHGVHDQMQRQFPDGTTSTLYPQPPDFLNLFSLPRYSPSTVRQNSSATFTNPVPKTSNFPSTLGLLGDVPSAVDTPAVTNQGLVLALQMYEGSCLYANAIAIKFIEVLDGQYSAVPPTSSY